MTSPAGGPGAPLWHGMDPATLDVAYNNTAAVAASARWIARWTERTPDRCASPGGRPRGRRAGGWPLPHARGARARPRLERRLNAGLPGPPLPARAGTVAGSHDYAIPKADRTPAFETAHTVTLSPVNPLGVKGIGQAGTIAASAAVVNSVVDALGHLGVRHLDMPLRSERVWQAIQAARAN